MTSTPPGRWSEIRPIFEEAVELDGPDRVEYLERTCDGDSELRVAVEKLLAADRDSGDFLSEESASYAAELLDSRLGPGGGRPKVVVGRRLGRYRVIARLGAGGMGEVYSAEDPELRRRVALKILPAAGGAGAERLERFRREAQALAAVDHPNVVAIHGYDEVDGLRLLSMELVDGVALEETLREGGLPLAILVRIGTSIADALDAIHARGITHRDLSSANVMLASPDGEVDASPGDGVVKVLDFGLAKLLEPDLPEGSTAFETLTATGQVLGTPPYMSPEQALGRAIDHRTDIFSLGVLLYEMAAGLRPFQAETYAMLVAAILRDEPAPLEEVRPDLPAALGDVVARCIDKAPFARYQTAAEVRDALAALAPPESG